MDLEVKEKLVDFLGEFVTPKRRDLIDRNVVQRTRYVTLALENIFQPHNASAVLRSADCFGIQDVHVIENSNRYNVNPDVVMGASKWVDLHRYNKKQDNTPDAIQCLKDQGYRIVATTPHSQDVSLEEFDLSPGKAAFFFGTELTGLSDVMMEQADEFVKIPMYGFTESFNISVSAALIMHHLTTALRSSDLDWRLSWEEQVELKLQWLVKSARNGEKLMEHFLRNFEKK